MPTQSTTDSNNSSTLRRGLLIVCIAALFYGYEFTLQSSPSVIVNQLMQNFQLSATGVSVLAAFFFYAYAPTQLLGGLLYDRFGPRRLLPLATSLCAIGALLFGLGPSVGFLAAGRFCMGLGGALSFVGALLLASRWLPLAYFPLAAGLLQSLASLGAVCGQVPLAALVHHIDWHWLFIGLGIFGLLLAISQWSIIRDWPQQIKKTASVTISKEKTPLIDTLSTVFGNLQTLWIGIYAFCIWLPIVVFAILWGIPYLHEAYQISITAASAAMIMVWLGVGIASPLFGTWSSAISQRKLPLATSAIIALIAGISIIYIKMPMILLYLMLFLFGLGASGQTLIFGVVKDIQPANVLGTAMGFTNLMVVLGGAICQPLTGFLLHWHWNKVMHDGRPFYSALNFKQSLFIIPLASLIAVLISVLCLRETHCRAQYEKLTQAPSGQN